MHKVIPSALNFFAAGFATMAAIAVAINDNISLAVINGLLALANIGYGVFLLRGVK